VMANILPITGKMRVSRPKGRSWGALVFESECELI
jgi:hypothetical protein